jgi:hypothetical protein
MHWGWAVPYRNIHLLSLKQHAMIINPKRDDKIQLNLLVELQNTYDKAIRQGEPFREVKRIYTRIKDLKRFLNSTNIE